MARTLVGAGVAVSVPAGGALLASAPAQASMPADTPSTPSSSAAQPRLAFGSTGSAVTTLQRRVGVNADGVFGALTLAGVKRFQSANGLVADGIVGPLTWAKLGSSSATTGSNGSTGSTTTPSKPTTSVTPLGCASSSTTLRYGSSGQLVKILQSRVGQTPDGFFGPATQKAVVSFQSSHGLVADGIVGALTWTKLGCTTATTPSTPSTSTSKPPVSTSGSTGSSSTATPAVSGAAVIAMAKRYVGVPYVWGGSTPAGFDCSGLTSYVYKQFGIYMPRTAAQQQSYFKSVTTPQVGDLIFYGSPAYHVAIYVGNGLMIDAAHPGAYVAVRSIYGAPSGYARVM